MRICEEITMEQIIYKTYEEWLKEGYQVLIGMKGKRIDNTYKFTQHQVDKLESLFLQRLEAECTDPNL